MSKKISLLSICLFLIFGNINIYAQTSPQTNLCTSKTDEVVAAFFNGIKNTKSDAKDSLEFLERFYGKTTPSGEKISYELLYNDSVDLFEDLAEVFEQRMIELEAGAQETLHDRYELFFQAIDGNGHWYNKVLDTIAASGDVAVAFLDDVRLKTQEYLLSLVHNSPTDFNYTEHQIRINNWILEGKKLLFIAHSQGNLFVNAAYDYAKSKTGEESVKVIHVAPASFRTSGSHVLADGDLIIKGLRSLVGNLPSVTNIIPSYWDRPAGANGKKDMLGHGFVEIYINPHFFTSTDIVLHINNALNSLKAPPKSAQSGFFTAILTWDGSGDVDLHVYEPDETWVYYQAKRGNAGYLDVDNVQGYGPEHYYASCDTKKLQEGIYTVKIANYRRAENRVATVQISSDQDGVIGTKTITLGEATGRNPAYHMFNVLVSKENGVSLK